MGNAIKASEAEGVGQAMYRLISELYPICRSITGEGVRRTLGILADHIPLVIHEVPTGTPVFDWTVPKEWNIRDAHILNAAGQKVVDFQTSNLHVVSYSVPIRARMPLRELRPHVHTLPEHPDWIPYRTTYYGETWGFCLSHNQLLSLDDGEYEVVIDSSLRTGSLTYGECFLRGEREEEVLVSTHICHPSLCNDNLSGIAVATFLAAALGQRSLKYSYRFLFIPGTIGSITWLSLNEAAVGRIRHGLVLACLGDAGGVTYKKSRRGDAEVDRAVIHVLRNRGSAYDVIDFSPYGYDERQYCSPGFNLPVGALSRTPHGRFPEYHTSADNLDFVRPAYLDDSLQVCQVVVDVLEGNGRYLNTNPKGEPQLGRRGIYGSLGGSTRADQELALLWVLNLSDGGHALLDIADRAGLPFAAIRGAADILLEHRLLAEAGAPAD